MTNNNKNVNGSHGILKCNPKDPKVFAIKVRLDSGLYKEETFVTLEEAHKFKYKNDKN